MKQERHTKKVLKKNNKNQKGLCTFLHSPFLIAGISFVGKYADQVAENS